MESGEYRKVNGLLMNLIQRAIASAQKAFTQMLFPTYNGGYGAWSPSSTLILPGVTDWRVNTTTNSAVMACVRWAARTFPEAPLQVVKVVADGGRDVQDKHRLPALLETPNPYYSGYTLWAATLTDWMTTGNAYWLKVRNGSGQVVQLWWVPQSVIEPKWDDKRDEFITHYAYTVDGREHRLDPADVVHFRDGIDPANLRKGLSPLAALLREIFTDEEAAAFSAALLKNMGVPGVVIAPKGDAALGANIDAAAALVIKEQFAAKTTGARRGEPIIMSGDVTVTTLSFNPDQMNLRDMRQVPEERITAVLGIPAIVVGLGAGLARSTFANMAEAREAAYESFILPLHRQFGAALRLQLLGDFGETAGLAIQFDTSGVRVLQEDENAKAARYTGLLSSGAITVAEMRQAIGLPVEPYHEVFLRPANIVEIPAGAEPPAPEVVVENTPPAQLPAPEKGLALEYKSYGGAVRAIERRAANATKGYLDEQYERAAKQLPLDFGDEARALWNQYYPLILRHAWRDAGDELGIELAFDLENQWVKEVLEELAQKITRVTDTTREEVRSLTEQAAAEGWGIDELAAKIRELKEIQSMGRARRIARTETATAYNLGSLTGYKEAGVSRVEVFDGDEHEPCASANGSIWTLEQAMANPLCHPNGTRAFAAVVED